RIGGTIRGGLGSSPPRPPTGPPTWVGGGNAGRRPGWWTCRAARFRARTVRPPVSPPAGFLPDDRVDAPFIVRRALPASPVFRRGPGFPSRLAGGPKAP